MGMHEERHGKGVVVSEFPSGLRVLAIDNDPVNLKVLEILLRMRNYHLTIARDAMTALRMLREGGRGNFDLVISDVYMSNMDGFKLLKLIDLEMDLPVIVLSANERPEAIVKAIAYGACGYLVKPVQTNDLNIMWRQVISRRTPDPWSFCSSIGNAAAEKAQPTGGAAGGEQGGAESTKYGWAKSHEHDGDDHDANKENVSPDRSTGKRLRTTWTSELHDKFVKAVSQIGINRAVPSKILAKMNVDNNVSRESVASHLQVYFLRLKYRMYLRGAVDEAEERRNLLAAERCNISRDALEEGIKYFHGQRIYRPSANPASWNPTSLPTGRDHTSAFGARGAGAHGGSMLFRDAAPRSSSLLPGARQWPSSSSSSHSRGDSSYMGILRGNLLGTNRGIFLADRDRHNAGMCLPLNRFPMQSSRQPGFRPPVRRNPYRDTGNCLGNSWQAAMKYPDLSRDDWRTTPGPSQANIPNINQLTCLGASPAGQIAGQVPMSLDELQNQIAAFLNSRTSLAGSSQEMAPFNVDVAINNNTSSVQMLNGNIAIDGNTSSVEMLDDDFAIDHNASWAEMLDGDFAIDDNTSWAEMLDGDFAIDDNTSSVKMLNGDFPINYNTSQVEMPNGDYAINNNISSVEAVNNNTSSVEMLNGNFALGSASSIGAALPDLEMGTSAAPTQMLNGGGAGGVLPVQAQSTANQEAVDGQLNINSDEFWEFGDF
ncbi:two-component response regulator orr25-like [Hordeum vulgare]|nr:two-component response regulator orr25-like [Hordeum vulgare]